MEPERTFPRLPGAGGALVDGAYPGPGGAANMVGNHARYDWVPVFTSNQYDLLVEYTGHAPRWDRVVFRGDPATRQFVAFWVGDGRVLAGMTANVAGLPDPIRHLVASRQPIEPAKLADPDVGISSPSPTLLQRNPAAQLMVRIPRRRTINTRTVAASATG